MKPKKPRKPATCPECGKNLSVMEKVLFFKMCLYCAAKTVKPKITHECDSLHYTSGFEEFVKSNKFECDGTLGGKGPVKYPTFDARDLEPTPQVDPELVAISARFVERFKAAAGPAWRD